MTVLPLCTRCPVTCTPALHQPAQPTPRGLRKSNPRAPAMLCLLSCPLHRLRPRTTVLLPALSPCAYCSEPSISQTSSAHQPLRRALALALCDGGRASSLPRCHLLPHVPRKWRIAEAALVPLSCPSLPTHPIVIPRPRLQCPHGTRLRFTMKHNLSQTPCLRALVPGSIWRNLGGVLKKKKNTTNKQKKHQQKHKKNLLRSATVLCHLFW